MRGKRSLRALLGVLALVLVVVAAPAAIERSSKAGQNVKLERFSATPDGEPESLNRLEAYWNDRITYPTGKFNPAWLRKAAAEDAKIAHKTPAGRKRGTAKGAADGGTAGTSASAGTDAGVGAAGVASDDVAADDLTSDDLTPSTPSSGAAFIPLGPKPLRMTGCSGCFNYTTTEGRVNAILVDPTTTTDGSIVAYAATVGGGVWKTTNCCTPGTTWEVTTDDPLISATAIDALAIDPNNHNTVYAGTGDLNYGSFSMGSQGILKTTDGGAHWTVLGAGVFGPAYTEPAGQFPQYDAVGKVKVDPNNSSNVVAGTKKGLFFSYDGGASWTGPCTTNAFTTQRQDITGLELTNVGGVTRIIAAVGVRGYATTVQYDLGSNGANGIYKATMPASGCPVFTSIAGNANGFVFGTQVTGSPYGTGANLNAGSGTPYGNATPGNPVGNQVGRIDLAVAPTNPDVVYAQVQSISQNSNSGGNSGCANAQGCQLGVFASTNGGTSWSFMAGSAGGSLRSCTNTAGDYPQNWYDQALAVDPNNADRVFVSTFDVWFATRTGTAFNDLSCGYSFSGAAGPVHTDQHAIAFVRGSSNLMLIGHDGGINVTTNAGNATATVDPTWANVDGGLNTIEFYSGDISGNFATSATPIANGGAQDNGSMSAVFSGYPTGPVQWQSGRGGDGFYARLDPVGTGSSLRFWQGNNSGSLGRCIGVNGAGVSNPCTNGGATWTTKNGGFTADQQSFILPYDLFHGGIPGGDDCAAAGPSGGCGNLVVGTTRVWETVTGNAANTNGAVSWYVTNSPSTQNLTKQTLGNRSFINQVKYSPKYKSVAMVGTNDGNAWIGRNLGMGTAGQALWTNLTDNNAVLPNRPVLGIALDPTVPAANVPVGYAAVGGFDANTPSTPGHVFRVVCAADCASFTWQNKSGNLPDIPVDAIIVNPNFPQQVFAGTDWGLYFTDNIKASSPTWYRFENSGIPNVMIWDMQIDRGATTLSVWTRGRGAYVWTLPLGPLDKNQTITFPAIADKVYGTADFDPGAEASSGLAVTYSATGACTIVSGKVHLTGAGSCSVKASQAGNTLYEAAPDVTRTFRVTKAPTTLTLASASGQYSDAITFTATITPTIGTDVPTGTVEFFVDGTSIGSAPLNASAVATRTAVITKAPGAYAVTAAFTSTNTNYQGSTGTGSLTVTQEDARPTYNGNSLFWTSSTTSDTADVTLSAAVRDITAVDAASDPDAGDIRNAKITFVDRATGNPLAGCSNLPVGLVNAFDTKTGVATCTTTLSLGNGNNTGGDQFAIGTIVSGYYTRDSAEDDTIVTVAQPIPSNFITGAGNLKLTDSAGIYAGDAGSKSNFGFNVKYNKAGTNVQGHMLVIVRSGDHVYQIKGNALSSLGVDGNTAQFSGKANIQDVTDPSHAVSVDGNATLQLWMTDNGEPGSADTIGIQVLNKSGGVWFSSNWSATNTVEQTLAGGNLAVHE